MSLEALLDVGPARLRINQAWTSGRHAPPPGSLAFDWAMTLLSAIFLSGVFLDGWAHTHGRVDDSFFTPWHAVVYSGYLAIAVFLVSTLVTNVVRGHPWRQAPPDGYGLSLLGVVLWAAGGPADLAWHQLVGFEANVEALLSPAHTLLGIGFALIVSGPLRAALRRPEASAWSHGLPMVLSLAFVMSVLTFFTQFAHPLANLWASGLAPTSADLADTRQELGLTGMLLTAAILTGPILLVLRERQLPVGGLSMVLTLNAGAMGFLFDRGSYPWPQVLAQSAAGVAADGLLLFLRPHADRVRPWRAFAFGVPTVFQLAYFGSLLLTDGIWWSPHLWLGSVVLCGVVGWLLSYLLVPPRPAVARR